MLFMPRHAGADHIQIAGESLQGRGIELHGDALHAIIGRHHDLCEVTGRRNALQRDRLRTKLLFDGRDGIVGVANGGQRAYVLLQTLHAFLRGIDRATDTASAACSAAAQGDQQVFQQHYGAAGRGAYDAAAFVDLPTFAETGQDDVLFLRVNKHVFHALQTAKQP